MKTTKRNLAIGAAVAILATIALAAAAGDRLKIPVTIGQGQAVTEALNFDIGNGSANPYVRSTSSGILQLSNDGGTHIMAVPTSSGSFMLNPLTSSGDVLYSSDNSGTPARLACGTGNTVLHGGTPPTCVAVATADFTGQLLVPKGGTGLASGTSGGVLAFTASTTLASSGVLGANQVVAGGGAGAAPATGGSTFIVGAGEAGSPTVTTVRGPAAAGANVIGADLYFDASDGTGTGGSGKIKFRTAPAAGSSSSANTFEEYLTVKNDGSLIAGGGDGTSAPHTGALYAASGAGANITGANLAIQPGNGTGSGGSGSIILSTAPAAASSSSANTMAAQLTVRNDGYVVLGTGDATATTTNGILAGTSRTGANAAASNLFIIAPNGTGNQGSGALVFQTGPAGASSSTAASMATAMQITNTQDVVIGGGEGTATTTNGTIRGASRTGSNALGKDLYIAAPNGTGTQGSGNIFMQTAPTQGTGSSAGVMATALSISNTGKVAIHGTTTNDAATAGYYGETYTNSAGSIAPAASDSYKTTASFTLQPGDYMVCGQALWVLGTATSTTELACVISGSTDSSSNLSGTEEGVATSQPATNFGSPRLACGCFHYQVASGATQAVKLNVGTHYSAVGSSTVGGSLTAWRIR